ncbi:fungal-specific transcription factor domain-containing protein [Hysterangium stoloniferum]|nr:fungal-specific transcription factor domain-containing protein [Hysterangium stoloniferum]
MQEPAPPALPAPTRKRKAKVDGDGETTGPEPRRLRRSHEACARCRSKKIKCDSKHPRCTACTNAGTGCHQEDRHRQTLTPRGHTEKIERQLAQCEMLLKRRIDNFHIDNLDEIMVREGLDPDVTLPAPNGFVPFSQTGPNGFPYANTSSGYGSANGLPYPNSHGPPGPVYSVPNGASYHPVYVPHMHPAAFNHHIAPQLQQQPPAPQPASSPSGSTTGVAENIKGQDPQSNDMSNTSALAKNFGVSAAIVQDLKLGSSAMDREDLAVGALHSGRDRDVTMDSLPRQPNNWIRLTVRRGSTVAVSGSQTHEQSLVTPASVWLPRDREMVERIVDIYFSRLDIHRPVFPRDSFKRDLASLYDATHHNDPGFICSVYIILALGTLSEMNHRACSMDAQEGKQSPRIARNLMPEDWPEHEEFFDRALAVKPDLRVTVSSLQALILLQWYLYTERQGRSLWRLVGSVVRLAVELGLHHDPFVQRKTFTPEERELRVRLWAIAMVHDRGTSLLLGRPLAIAPAYSNTPHPKQSTSSDFSEHFAYSSPIADIQGDIVVSLYGPNKQTPDAIWKHATRIIKSINDFQLSLPPHYQRYFSGTGHWSDEERRQLVADITESQGLTMLKIGIARILLLRALFSAKELSFERRSKALDDAIVTSHNIIIVHNEMIRFPDIAFFVSPIPLHIAAMVILYGHMSSCKMLTRQQALEDVWMALDMLPRFRWRWDRKDHNGSHPLIAKLAEKVFEAPLHQAGPTSRPMLMPELDWSTADGSTTPGSPMVATPSPAQPQSNGYPPPPAAPYHRAPSKVKLQEGILAEVPPQWFYPLPHEQPPIEPPQEQHTTAAAAAAPALANGGYAPLGTIGCAPSHDSYMQEEKDAPVPANSQMELWMSMVSGGFIDSLRPDPTRPRG